MATTIITKHTNGSGAPTPDKVSVGELAIDLVGQQLYTKDNNGDVIKLGSGKGAGNIADGTAQGQTTIWNETDEEWQANSTLNVIGTNVGIGTDSTNHGRLTVQADGKGVSTFLRDLDGTYNPFIETFHEGIDGVRVHNSSTYGSTASNYTQDVSGHYIVKTGGIERMRIDAQGRVGIGTDNPQSLLHVRGSGGNTGIIQIGTTGGTVAREWKLITPASTGQFSIQDATASINRITIDTTGRVGIGTDSPEYNLSVVSNTGTATIGFKDSGTSVQGKIRIRSQSENLEFITGGGVRQTIDEQGRVGIGGTPSRSTKEIEEEAEATLASWEPKDTKDKKPTKAELIQRLTERTIDGGSALLQVAGSGFFKGQSGITSLLGSGDLGLTVSGGVQGNNDYSGISFSGGFGPFAKIGAKFTGAGSLLAFGTSNNYGLGVTNEALIIDPNGDATFSGDVSCSTINGALPFNTRHIIETLETLRDATKDETTLEGLRDSIGNAVGGLIEKFEAMQNSAVTQDIQE